MVRPVNTTSDIMRGIYEAEQEAMQRATGKIGWTYSDLPKMSLAIFNQFVEIVGEGNLSMVTYASYQIDYEEYRRGQVMISPTGMSRLTAWLEVNDDNASA